MKITDIDKKVAAAAAEIEKAAEQTRQDEARKEELSRQMTEAAEAGDLALYRALKGKIDEIDDASFVRATHLRKMNKGVTVDEVSSAWSGYAADYNKRLHSGLADLERQKEALLNSYAALIEMQKEALLTRDRLAGYVDIDGNRLPMEFIPFKPEQYRAPSTDALAVFYILNRRDQSPNYSPMRDPVTESVQAVVMNHRPK